jgi:hypothetical protein
VRDEIKPKLLDAPHFALQLLTRAGG